MNHFPAALQELADQFARLPGIGGKTAQRLAFHVLGLPMQEAQEFADAILNAKNTVHTCPVCQGFTWVLKNKLVFKSDDKQPPFS